MKTRNDRLLLHPLFIVSILLLLLNDILLKYAFHNSLTGKLSDFTGLFAFSIFLLAFFDKQKISVLIFCALFFIWWKSPLSQPAIDGLNAMCPFRITRVIDYTDLLALIVLPVSYFIGSSFYYPPVFYRRFYLNLSCIISLFALCNTTAYRQSMYEYPKDRIYFREEFTTKKSEAEILAILSPTEKVIKDSIHFYTARQADYYYKENKGNDSALWHPLFSSSDSSLYIRVRESSPYWIIRSYSLDGDVLENIEIKFQKGKNKNRVILESFVTNAHKPEEFYSSKFRRKYKRHFKAIFK